jgi:superfamily I DNA and RNA helicase
MATARFGGGKEFEGACAAALVAAKEQRTLYDMILVDEAQDFPPEFLRLCYRFLHEPKRLVYAYDELQSLTGNAVLPPEELFGKDATGKPLVPFNYEDTAVPRQDIILEKCYRNSRPVLTTAHALGFGIYRSRGLVQLFDQDSLWTDVGYVVTDGELKPGSPVKLARTEETSPRFLENHSPIDDLIQFHKFASSAEQSLWLVEQIKNDLRVEELRPDDIVVINPNPLTTEREVGPARKMLLQNEINSELAGVSTSRDVFQTAGSITFTGIFRAKGNEAGMIYIINAQDCFSAFSKPQLALFRNRLFTAITRSKAWVRVLGIGPGMDGLGAEWQALKSNDYQLSFTYPTEAEKQELRLINRDLTPKAKSRQKKLRQQAREVLEAIRAGELEADAFLQELGKRDLGKK